MHGSHHDTCVLLLPDDNVITIISVDFLHIPSFSLLYKHIMLLKSQIPAQSGLMDLCIALQST